MRSLPPGQFDIDRVSSVRDAILQANSKAIDEYGRGNYRWISLVGDLSCMYDELDPSVAVERVAESCEQLPDWLGKRSAVLTGLWGCLVEPCRLMDTTARVTSCGSRRWT